MGTGIGQILDKYELLEKVGQGGMAVVYRGLDTTLRREVAVKVLHRHLADHKEARDRFEREAQAVAKLRHENILEIFDFSGNDSEESYIVTEFIDGQTLKEFITEHEIKYPEIGAMITVQVCKALSHAHSLGVLHRDVKPENIMIRNDGVVKLTDFGIAQMLDHQRLTVTGQLLGSPAYMSPEHIEGGQLDFRTDVFAAGIVLYQLCCGDLPFRGKNPHEILKRIAECSFTDPRQMNPLIGNELRGIIVKCLAREKDDRYADVTQMQAALEQHLTSSGLEGAREELGRFFASPVSYEMALQPRLVSALTGRGREKLAEDRNLALDYFNRVLTLDKDNKEVLEEIDRMSRQRRWVRTAALFGGIVLLAGGALAARHFVINRPKDDPALALGDALDASAQTSTPIDGGAGTTAAAPFDAAPTGPATNPTRPDHPVRPPHNGDKPPPPSVPDAGAVVSPEVKRRFSLEVSPDDSAYQVDGTGWKKAVDGIASFEVGPGDHVVSVKNDECCIQKEAPISAGAAPGTIKIQLDYLGVSVTPVCDTPGVTVAIDGRKATLGRSRPFPFASVTETKRIRVTFSKPPDGYDPQTIELKPGESREVKCKL